MIFDSKRLAGEIQEEGTDPTSPVEEKLSDTIPVQAMFAAFALSTISFIIFWFQLLPSLHFHLPFLIPPFML